MSAADRRVETTVVSGLPEGDGESGDFEVVVEDFTASVFRHGVFVRRMVLK